MELKFRFDYTVLKDKEIVNLIISKPYDEEAAVFLIYKRYNPLLFKLYRNAYNNDLTWFDDCLNDLFIYLKGKKQDWNKLRSIEWRSQFGTWLRPTAWNRFLEIKPKLIGKEHNALSIDDRNEKSAIVQIPSEQECQNEELQMKILLMEAISQLKDSDQKFVILKRLAGYNSQQIAELMQKSWEKHGIKKYNKEGKRIIPTPGYVNVRTQRAKENLRRIIGKSF